MTERNELPKEFALTDEQQAEIKSLADALHKKCVELEAPVMIAICVSNSDENWESAEANYFNGVRTPDAMAIARVIVEKNISSPLQLLALMTSK